MTPNEYQELAKRTAAPAGTLEQVELGIDGCDTGEMIHCAFGMASEAGELQSAIKAAFAYKRILDRVNCLEECGDILWFVSGFLGAMGYTLEECMAANLRKLRARYPEKFTTEAALKRDLDAEKAAMVGGAK